MFEPRKKKDWKTASKIFLNDSFLLEFMPIFSLLLCLIEVISIASKILWMLQSVMSWFARKRHSSLNLALFWINCSGEARCLIVRTGMYPYGKSHMMQNSVVNSQHHLASHVCKSSWKQNLQLQSHSNDCTLAIF